MTVLTPENFAASSAQSETSPKSKGASLTTSDAALIISAFAGRGAATVDEVVDLTKRLLDLEPSPVQGNVIAAVVETAMGSAQDTPAVDPALSVDPDKVTCLCCGKKFTMLKRHLMAEHGMTEAEYRTRFGLSPDHPLVAPNYSKRKADYARRIGLGKHERDLAATEEFRRSQ
ncbi:MAG: MucR family transcriptional regulator [Rhodobacteraceae bacterium]|nr:MucR family transcriptional regulator [Paracoccaceae bacterium]